MEIGQLKAINSFGKGKQFKESRKNDWQGERLHNVS